MAAFQYNLIAYIYDGTAQSGLGDTAPVDQDTGPGDVVFGGPGNLWGNPAFWTPAFVNNNLRVGVQCEEPNGDVAFDVSIDAVAVTVYYTTPGGGSGSSTAVFPIQHGLGLGV